MRLTSSKQDQQSNCVHQKPATVLWMFVGPNDRNYKLLLRPYWIGQIRKLQFEIRTKQE